MNDFTSFQDTDNIGGCQSFQFIPVNQVVSIPDPIDFVIPTEPTLLSGATFFNGYSTAKTLLFDEKTQKNNAGEYFLQKISGFYPKIRPSILKLFKEMKNHKFIVLVHDNNNMLRMVGTLEQPLEFSYSLSTGTNPVQRNGITFEFTAENELPAPMYNPQ